MPDKHIQMRMRFYLAEDREDPEEQDEIFTFGHAMRRLPGPAPLIPHDTSWVTDVHISAMAYEYDQLGTIQAAIEACCHDMRNHARTIANRLLGLEDDPTQRNP